MTAIPPTAIPPTGEPHGTEPSPDGAGPLQGLRVIDLTMFVAGPVATMVLADLGATVIKIEPLTGDPVRTNNMGPTIDGESAQFHSYNRNKRSIAVDLKHDQGRALVRRLCLTADVVIDNFRPGALARLGLDHESLRFDAPGLVSCSISAFGQTGPWRERPGFDLVVQALSGAMSLTGHAETGPAHIPGHLGDTASGLYAVIGVLAALAERQRTGVGRAVDVALLDSLVALLGDEVTHAAAGLAPVPHRGGHPLLFPYEAFPTRDHPLVVAAVGVDKFWPALCGAVGRPDLGRDPRFTSNDGRVANRDHLHTELSAVFRTRPRAAWLAVLAAADVPATPVNTVDEVLTHEQTTARAMIVDAAREGAPPTVVAGNPVKVAGHDQRFTPAPRLGADTADVLGRLLNLDPATIAELRADGVIG